MNATAIAAVTGKEKDKITSSGNNRKISFTNATGRSFSNKIIIMRVDRIMSKVRLGIFAFVICAIRNKTLI
jgi:hypothetical protein